MKYEKPSEEIVERIRKEYPKGCRVELIHMEDKQAPPVGTQGTVRSVDDIGTIFVQVGHWVWPGGSLWGRQLYENKGVG